MTEKTANTPAGRKKEELFDRAAQAARDGNWELASQLLERCCKLAGFRNSQLNSQWMVAADRAAPGGDPGRRALLLADAAWRADLPGQAMEFLQLAMFRPPQDAVKAAEARRFAEEWPAGLAARLGSPLSPETRDREHRALRIGHLLGCLNPTHAPTRLVQALTGELSSDSVQSFIYTSEWASGWFHNWSSERQSGPEDFLSAWRGAAPIVQEARGGFVERALRLAQRIARDTLDVLVVHASNVEMVTALVASLRPASRQVNVNHASEMILPCFDGYVHMFSSGLRRSRARHVPATVIYPASDMAGRLRTSPHGDPRALGIPAAATISGTFGNLYKVGNPLYLTGLRGVLEAHPGHHHLLAGGGDQRNLRQFLDQSGLGSRVHLLGPRTDIPVLLSMLDFYLASHPYPGALSEIEAMAAGCPVISMRGDPDSHDNAGAEVVGLEECLVNQGDSAGVAVLASRLLADRHHARDIGSRLRRRYEEHFLPAAVAARHLEFYRSIIDRDHGSA